MNIIEDLESYDGYRITDTNVIRDALILFLSGLVIFFILFIYGG